MRFVFTCPSCKAGIEADSSVCGRQSPCPQCGNLVAVPESRVDAGTTLAGFRLERRLGKGGMGEVWLATQLSVKRQVAVKVLPPGFASSPEAVQRFLHEGQLAARLDHANIVTVHEAGEDHGTFYLAMAYVEGESLDQRLKREKLLPEKDALAIVRAVADALAYAWETFQLLHRDLKPANLMVDHRGRVFLMDLGLAKSLAEESGFTLSGSILGTPQYMSPEQAEGHSDLGVATDIYALGASLYHLVTGSPPFVGDTTLKVLNQHVHAPLPPPRSRNPQLSEGCAHLLERTLAKKPSERYGDWRALIADVDRVLAGQAPARVPLEPAVQSRDGGTPAVSPAASKAAMARQAQAALARQHGPAPQASAPRRRFSPLAVGLAAAAVVVVLLGGLLALRGPSGGEPAGAHQAGPTSQTSPTSQTEPPTPKAAPATPPAESATPGPAAAQPAAASAPTPAAVEPAPAESGPTPPAPAPTTAPAEVAAPAPAAPPTEPPESVAATPAPVADLGPLAAPILAGRPAEALQRWQAQGEELGRGLTAEQRQAVAKQLEALAGIDTQVLASLKADIGKTVDLELANERVTGDVREVTAAGLRVNQALSQGKGTLGRTIPLADLSLSERLRRLGTGDTPELALQRGFLALAAGRPDNARTLFGTARVPLGEALVKALDARRAEARKDAAEQAVGDLLRQISTSPELHSRTKVIAAIRRRCEGDLKRVQTARRLLAGFEKEWGNTAAGKPWAAVVREALFYPWAGDAPLAIPDLGMELVPVPAGSFLMGSSAGDPGEQPVHSVQITRAFWLGKHEVTQGQYEKLAGTNPCQVPDALNPVDSVSWHQATAFCAQLSEEERRAGRVPDGYAYRLPSEAEWEYAVRGGPVAKGHGYAGSDNANEVGWYGENSGGRTHRVGQKRPNELGLCDMIGNVCEWCLDYYEKTYYSRSPGADPANMQVSALRVFRGGSMVEPATGIGPGVRGKLGPHDTTAYIGFRVCLGPVITE